VTHTVGGIPEDKKMMGCFKNSNIQNEGLKDFGREVVKEMFRFGMIVDLSHSTPKAREEIYQINNEYKKPLIFSHAGVAKYNSHPMSPTDEEIKMIADTGGVIGVILMNHWLNKNDTKHDIGLENILCTIKHIKATGGVDCIAIGSDLDGFTDPPDDLKDESRLPAIVKAFEKSGEFTAAHIEQICKNNALRVLENGWLKN